MRIRAGSYTHLAKDAKTNHANHANLANYKDYGLTFRFYIPTAPYNTLGGVDGNTNKTDQQKFDKLDSHENGIMSSKVYTVEGLSLIHILQLSVKHLITLMNYGLL